MLRRIWKDFDGSIEYSLNIHEMAHFGAWIFVEYSGIFRELNIRPGNIQFATSDVSVLAATRSSMKPVDHYEAGVMHEVDQYEAGVIARGGPIWSRCNSQKSIHMAIRRICINCYT